MIPLATKTPLLKEGLRRLNSFNDQLCYFTFVEEEFERKLNQVDAADRQLYTSHVFTENSRAKRIHVRVKDLPAFERAAKSSALGAFASTSYETVASYMEEAILLLGKNAVPPPRINDKDPVELRLQSAAEQVGCKTLDSYVTELLAYLRLRRNHFVHLSVEPTDALKYLTKYQGKRLNEYWTTRGALDFSQNPPPELGEDEAIDFIKLLRVCIRKLDETVASGLNPVKVLRRLDENLIREQSHLKGGQGYERRAQKLRDVVFELYGINCKREAISEVMWQEQ